MTLNFGCDATLTVPYPPLSFPPPLIRFAARCPAAAAKAPPTAQQTHSSILNARQTISIL
jgi:hypothetical protein